MPKFIAQEKSFINGTLVEANAEVDYDGKPGPNLKAKERDKEAVKAEADAEKDRGTRNIDQGDLVRQKVAAIGGDPDATDAAQAINAAGAAATAALQGKTVIVDNHVISGAGAA